MDRSEEIMPVSVAIKRVRIPFAESLRFPGEGSSAQGKSDPKPRPKGVGDGKQGRKFLYHQKCVLSYGVTQQGKLKHHRIWCGQARRGAIQANPDC